MGITMKIVIYSRWTISILNMYSKMRPIFRLLDLSKQQKAKRVQLGRLDE